jgi:hypothetical protein
MSSNRPLGRMLVSKQNGREVDIDVDKVSRGSFYTRQSNWLTPEVRNFLACALKLSNSVLDPFAGSGHLLQAIENDPELSSLTRRYLGLDIQGELWPSNDSLDQIPNPHSAVIVTNPPYLANHSAKRKGVDSLVSKYFIASGQDNLYKVALQNSLAAAEYVVAIVPETFLLSSFPKDRLVLAVVIEAQLFGDTEAPAVVGCFGPKSSGQNPPVQVFVGEQPIAALDEILKLRAPKTKSKHKIVFNVASGRIGLRAVDGSKVPNPIAFLKASEFNYQSEKVLESSRLMTYLEIPKLTDHQIEKVIVEANSVLGEIRQQSADLVLAPFKGNDNLGIRRRRLDYVLARRILNLVVDRVLGLASVDPGKKL